MQYYQILYSRERAINVERQHGIMMYGLREFLGLYKCHRFQIGLLDLGITFALRVFTFPKLS
jgi:hypothetical protein